MNDHVRSPAPGRVGKTSVRQTDSSATCHISCIDRGRGAPSIGAWTPACVQERLRKAAELRESLTGCNTEFAPVGEGIGIIGIIGGNAVGMDHDDVDAGAAEALSWLSWLEPDDTEIVVARLQGTPWKLICWRFGISRATANRRWRYGLRLIARYLNGDVAPGRPPSMRALLRRSATP